MQDNQYLVVLVTRCHLTCLCFFFQKLSVVLDELESLKPKFQRLLNERNKAHAGTQDYQLDAQGRISYGLQESPSDRKASLSLNDKQVFVST